MNRPEESETASEELPLLLLDACCAINLLASGEARAILAALGGFDVAEVSLVVDEEVVEVYSGPEDKEGDEEEESERTRTSLTLDPLVQEGLLRVLSPEGEEEETTYVDLALHLDDGEAMTGAVAVHRGGSVATDDRKAIRVLGAQESPPRIRRTSWLIRTWAESADVGSERLRRVLGNVERRGSFFPPPDDPLRDWWLGVTGRE